MEFLCSCRFRSSRRRTRARNAAARERHRWLDRSFARTTRPWTSWTRTLHTVRSDEAYRFLRHYYKWSTGSRCRSLDTGRSAADLAPRSSWCGCDDNSCALSTSDLMSVCREADIIVAAAGQAGMITADHVRPGATVIDVVFPAVKTESSVMCGLMRCRHRRGDYTDARRHWANDNCVSARKHLLPRLIWPEFPADSR